MRIETLDQFEKEFLKLPAPIKLMIEKYTSKCYQFNDEVRGSTRPLAANSIINVQTTTILLMESLLEAGVEKSI